MPVLWFSITVKFVAPIGLSVLLGSTIFNLIKNNFLYESYPIWANIVFGWLFTILVLGSGFIIKYVVNKKKKSGFIENPVTWEN